MLTCNEAKIRSRIDEITSELYLDDKTGCLSDEEYKKLYRELKKCERDLRDMYILHQLAPKRKLEELDLSLLPICDEADDSDMTSCLSRHEASCYLHKRSDSLQK